ncbi:unnamed protein product, partial [Discosporangium mesarthrocarpum]
MAIAVTSTELGKSFARIGEDVTDSMLLEKCLALCQRYNLTASDLANHWESFAVNNDGSKLGLPVLAGFESGISKATAAATASARKAPRPGAVVTPRPSEKSRVMTKITSNDLHSPSSTGTKRPNTSFSSPTGPASKIQRHGESTSLSPTSVQSPPDSSISYATRSNAGQKTVEYNAELGLCPPLAPSSRRKVSQCEVTVDSSVGAPGRYRYMYTPLEERAAALEACLVRLQREMEERLGLGELTPVGAPRQEEVVVVGRVCCETSEGKINRASIILEGSRRHSGGQRVHLDVRELQSFSFFPGQIVAVRGINSSGGRMVARGIVDGVPRPLGRSLPAELIRWQHGPEFGAGRPVSMLVAAGPFSTSDNLAYEPLNDILGAVTARCPDVVFLVGPFVDAMHPKVAVGDASVECVDGGSEPVDFETLFKLRVSDKLDTLFSDKPTLHTQFVLVPSLRDAFHEYVYPQPPFHDRVKGGVELGVGAYPEEKMFVLDIPRTAGGGVGGRKRVHLTPNPTLVRINGVTVGATSNDVIFDISGDEVSARAGNRLARLSEHLLRQQSFYPLFPPPLPAVAAGGGVPLDLRHAPRWELPVTPDVLLLPSRLAQFAKEVQGCLCVNPGQVARGTGGGTYAEMAIHPMPKEALEKVQ